MCYPLNWSASAAIKMRLRLMNTYVLIDTTPTPYLSKVAKASLPKSSI